MTYEEYQQHLKDWGPIHIAKSFLEEVGVDELFVAKMKVKVNSWISDKVPFYPNDIALLAPICVKEDDMGQYEAFIPGQGKESYILHLWDYEFDVLADVIIDEVEDDEGSLGSKMEA